MAKILQTLKHWAKPPSPVLYKSGSNALRTVFNLRVNDEGLGLGVNSPEVVNFMETYGFNSYQFEQLEDLLLLDMNTAERISGSRLHDYELHLDYKLRNSEIARKKTPRDTLNLLKARFPDFPMHTSNCEVSKRILKKFATKLIPVRTSLDVSSYSQAEYSAVEAKLNELEKELLNEDLQPETKEKIALHFKEVREKLHVDPFNTCVDIYAWLNGTLLGSGMKSSLMKAAEPQELLKGDSTVNENGKYLIEAQQRELELTKEKITSAWNVYNNEDENYAQVLSAEKLTQGNLPLVIGGLGVINAYWLYLLYGGCANHLTLLAVPVLNKLVWDQTKPLRYANMETVKEIFQNKETNTLDLYFAKNGNVNRVLKGLSVESLRLLSLNEPVTDFGALPFKPKEKSLTVSELVDMGLPPTLIPVSIEGKINWMQSNCRMNQGLVEKLWA